VARKLLLDAGAKPTQPFPGIYLKWESQCMVCFRHIKPTLANVRAGHSPCVYCSGKRVDKKTAFEFAITRGLKPLVGYPGATKRWKVKCLKCERNSTVSWVTLQLKKKNAGCSSCTEFGFKSLEPAYLYLISHPDLNAHKVGIGNTNAKRIEKHLKNGWQIHRVYMFKKGSVAHQIEQSTIDWLRNIKGLGPAYRSGDGWTETVPANQISVHALNKKVLEYSKNRGSLVKASHFERV
jgi:hypothetical protein